MTLKKKHVSNRAVVLGGGGVTGIAWEVGILTGLLEAGVTLNNAEKIIGTSAGAFVGTALASQYDMRKLFAAQIELNDTEVSVKVSENTMKAWYEAFNRGGSNPQAIGAAFGSIAKKNPKPVPVELRRSVVESRLVATEWPMTLQVTAIDADLGKLQIFNYESGVPLIDAVAASGAVPGIWPPVRINDRVWIDGGMVSTTNARLAEGYDQVVILAPMPNGHGAIPGVEEDVEQLSAHAHVHLIIPNEKSRIAIGSNPYDPPHCRAAAIAGKNQGEKSAAEIRAMWSL